MELIAVYEPKMGPLVDQKLKVEPAEGSWRNAVIPSSSLSLIDYVARVPACLKLRTYAEESATLISLDMAGVSSRKHPWDATRGSVRASNRL